ncbi:MAG: glycosyl transferase family 1 [Thermoprotei archaeon]|nr:MAG: glycosyl transferase family 1 [Thermoprotei archaeon]
MAEKLKDLTVVHVNSTAFGGGVAEILSSMIPLMNSIGLKAEWEVIEAPSEFFNITKLFHHGVQGMEVKLTDEMKEFYLKINKENAEKLDLDKDIIVIHDPQPLAIRYYRSNCGKWVWRCHIDASTPYKPVWDFVINFVKLYDAYIFHMEEYVQPEIDKSRAYVIKPSIDPLSEKNREMSNTEIEKVLERYDVNPEKPILIQVARFDPWKDPLGAIDVYRKVKEKIPDVQLLFIASMANDDPEGWIYYEKTARHAGNDYDIHFLTNIVGVGDKEVNAFQRAADVALQMSIREGFGLSVTEALWKGTPVVARGVGGIKVQVINGKTGFIIKGVNDASEKIVYLLKNKSVRDALGRNGREHVRRNFLITRHLYDYLKLFSKLTARE